MIAPSESGAGGGVAGGEVVLGLGGVTGTGVGFATSGGGVAAAGGGVDSCGTGGGAGSGSGGGVVAAGIEGVAATGGAGMATVGFFWSQHPPDRVSRALTSTRRTKVTRWRSSLPEVGSLETSKAL